MKRLDRNDSLQTPPSKKPFTMYDVQGRQQRLKEIDALYKSQISKIYPQNKELADSLVYQQSLKSPEKEDIKSFRQETVTDNTSSGEAPNKNQLQSKQPLRFPYEQSLVDSRLVSPRGMQMKDRIFIEETSPTIGLLTERKNDNKFHTSTMLQEDSAMTIEVLRRENQNKEMKIRELTTMCRNWVQKLKGSMTSEQMQEEIGRLNQVSGKISERLEKLFQVKHEEIFFKTKLQVISLLQQFQLEKQEITPINEVSSQSDLFSFMCRKLKTKLKEFKSKQHESIYQLQKEKNVNQKCQQRIHYLLETNQLLRLSQSKLKQKNQQLRSELNNFIQKIGKRQSQCQQRQSQIFRLKRQLQQSNNANSRIISSKKTLTSQFSQEKKAYEAREKELKTLLSNNLLENKKLQSQIEEKDTYIEQLKIKGKFIEQESQRINREFFRWKERFQWLQKEKERRVSELEQEKAVTIKQLQDYMRQNPQEMIMSCKAEADEALARIQEYQIAYQKLLQQIEEQRRLSIQRQDRKTLQLQKHYEMRISQLQQEKAKKESLLNQQVQTRVRTLLAQQDSKTAQQVMELEIQNEELKKEIESLNKVLEVKEGLINIINGKRESGLSQGGTPSIKSVSNFRGFGFG